MDDAANGGADVMIEQLYVGPAAPVRPRIVEAVQPRETGEQEQTQRRPLVDRLLLRVGWIAAPYSRFVLAMPRWLPGRRRLIMSSLRRSAAALTRHDLDVYLLGFAPEVEWEVKGDMPEAGLRRGLDEIRNYLVGYFEPWSTYENRPLELLGARADRVAFSSQLTVSGRASGVQVEQYEAYCVEMHRGSIVRLAEFRDRESALEAFAA